MRKLITAASTLPKFTAALLFSTVATPRTLATQVALTTPLGEIRVELHDDKPVTVANFLAYLNGGLYGNSFSQRLVPGFILQGGGYTLQGNTVTRVPAFAPIINEYSVGQTRSNLIGTIAMAKLGGDPNSATSEWFLNLADNSSNLDNQNGGFTVFGNVVAGLDVLTLFNTTFNASAIGGRGVYDASSILGPAFSTMPLLHRSLTASNLITTGWTVVPQAAYWKGSTSGMWNQASNFATTVAGITSYSSQFNGSTSVIFNATGAVNFANTQLGTDLTIKTLNLSAPSPVGIGGTNKLTINPDSAAVGITVESGAGTVTNTISSGLVLGANQSWTVTDAAQSLVVSGEISGNFTLTKAGNGVLNLNGAQGYAKLDAKFGTTNVNGAFSGGTSDVSVTGAGTKLKFGSVSQTLSSLTIGAGSTVTFTSGVASGAFSGGGGQLASLGDIAAVPEPGTTGLLLIGVLGILGRRHLRRTSG